MEKDVMESMLRELIKYEENNDYFFLTRRERREFQAYVERLMEIGEIPPHGRLIDADALINDINQSIIEQKKVFDSIKEDPIGKHGMWIDIMHDKRIVRILENAPTIIEAEVKEEAKSNAWLKRKSMIYCSECCESFDAIFVNDFNYCPNCGADMRGGK